MKFAIVFACLIVAASAATARLTREDIKLISRNFVNDGNSYKFGFEQDDGQKREEAGEIKIIDKEPGIVMRGSFSFVADDGQTYSVTYVADENGFQPSGAHLPV